MLSSGLLEMMEAIWRFGGFPCSWNGSIGFTGREEKIDVRIYRFPHHTIIPLTEISSKVLHNPIAGKSKFIPSTTSQNRRHPFYLGNSSLPVASTSIRLPQTLRYMQHMHERLQQSYWSGKALWRSCHKCDDDDEGI